MTYKLIIAGGRGYRMRPIHQRRLEALFGHRSDLEIVSGGCTGADMAGEVWAHKRGLKVTRMSAEWDTYGPSAGPIRNRKMAEYADALFYFPGSRGTLSMVREAQAKGIPVWAAEDEGIDQL